MNPPRGNNRLLSKVAELLHWMWQVAKKWVWLLGLFPAMLDIASTYISGLPRVKIAWQWSVGFGCLGFLASSYLVYLDLKARLAIYENQEPEYDLQVLGTDSKMCPAGQIHIDSAFRMTCKNPWPGELIRITLADSKLPGGIASGVISDLGYQPLDRHCPNPLKFPYGIPPAGCDFQITLHYPINEPLKRQDKEAWESMVAQLLLLVGFVTQPVGYVQKCLPLNIPVNLGAVFEELTKRGSEEI